MSEPSRPISTEKESYFKRGARVKPAQRRAIIEANIALHVSDPREDIKAAIEFYEARGWDWLMVVSYLSAKATGHWPLPKGFFIRREKIR